MKIFARLFALFLIMPIVELYLLIQLSQLADGFTDGFGVLFTIGLIVLTGALGSFLAKREGVDVWRRLNERVKQGQMPGNEVVDGVIILVSGGLLISPGVISDMLGIIGLLPPTRILIRRYVMHRLKRSVKEGNVSIGFGGFGSMSYPEKPAQDSQDSQEGWHGDAKRRPEHRQNEP